MFDYTVETSKSIDDAVESLELKLKEDSFGVLWDFDVKKTLENKGLDYEPNYRILEVCNPKAAKELLEKNHMVGYFLPCKITVYESKGKTFIGMPRPTELIKLTKDNSLYDFAYDIENTLIKVMDAAK
ncbi:DUF302 domain-containing protein [Virgibacillus litoralis]|uniref:Uncharacterized protein (DUF302 family) n=1 Tax=Virgibacillus litoralis TaxID=578221 RepID=A0ABS4HJP2_9BACI|nr:DUF302 domain-containing protein [Virgibacillus litoralis]MBP1950834.1 uncharacterized protein (DUF302 family) [Virgibacillus litoralis]